MASQRAPPKSLGNVLVVGGCGFLGSAVVDQLLAFPSENSIPTVPITSRESSTSPLSTSTPVDPAYFKFPSLRSRYPAYTNTTVHVLDLRCTHNRFPGAFYHEGDISNPSALLEIFKIVKPDVVINTASPTVYAAPALLRKVNIDGTKALLEVAGGVHGDWGGKCKAFVHTSSSSVVHDSISDLINVDERWPLVVPNPVEAYSESKAIAESIVLSANKKYNDMLTCAVRPAGIVGENDRAGWSHGILTAAANSASWQLHVQLGPGNNLFDNTYVGNVVYGLLLAADCLVATYLRISSGGAAPLDTEKVDGEAFNVTNDEPAYFWDAARYCWTLYGRQIDMNKVWVINKRLGIVIGGLAELSTLITGRKTSMTRQTFRYACMTRFYNCDKLKLRCGYRPRVGLQEAMQRAVKSFVVNERMAKEVGDKEGGQKKKMG